MKKFLYFTSMILLFLCGCSKDNPTEIKEEDPVVLQNGTAENPFLIKTKQELIQMRDWVNNDNANYGNKVYKLMADLDFAGEPNWIPIGTSETTVGFKGIFEGNGKVINNIQIGSEGTIISITNAGLFGYVFGGEIKNLGVKWNQINSTANAGGVVGMASGSTINNCYSTGKITGEAVGGIAGIEINSKISNCYSTATITGGLIGGIVGNSNGTISDCYTSGKVSGPGCSGGIAGQASNIVKCYSTGDITGGFNVGGIAGIAFSILNCYSTGIIKSTLTSCCLVASVGGISGGAPEYTSYAFIINCYSTGSVISSPLIETIAYAGGIIGRANSCSVINCYSSAIVSSTSLVCTVAGGIASSCQGNILNCYSSGDISSISLAEGASINYAGAIKNSSFSGGILGVSSNAVINNCLALNTRLKAICAYSSNYTYISRISWDHYSTVSNNFASTTMVVQKGKTESNISTITNFSDSMSHGSNLTANPVDLLNSYVSANPNYLRIPLLSWKVQAGVNSGLPVFNN